jgi:hypothetical protein
MTLRSCAYLGLWLLIARAAGAIARRQEQDLTRTSRRPTWLSTCRYPA